MAIQGSAFSVRDVKYWNKLPPSVVTAPSATFFKKRLEKVLTSPNWLTTDLPFPFPKPTIISICYPTPCSIYMVSSGSLWPPFCQAMYIRPLLNTRLPNCRHCIARKTEKHHERNRNPNERPFSSFLFWIDLNWMQSRLCWRFVSLMQSVFSFGRFTKSRAVKASNMRFLHFRPRWPMWRHCLPPRHSLIAFSEPRSVSVLEKAMLSALPPEPNFGKKTHRPVASIPYCKVGRVECSG